MTTFHIRRQDVLWEQAGSTTWGWLVLGRRKNYVRLCYEREDLPRNQDCYGGGGGRHLLPYAFQIPAVEHPFSPDVLDRYVGIYSTLTRPRKLSYQKDGLDAWSVFQPPARQSGVPLEATARDKFPDWGGVRGCAVLHRRPRKTMILESARGSRVFNEGTRPSKNARQVCPAPSARQRANFWLAATSRQFPHKLTSFILRGQSRRGACFLVQFLCFVKVTVRSMCVCLPN